MKYALVYQAGIANVFAVDCWNLSAFGRNAVRRLQGTFLQGELFAQGLRECGADVKTFACNEAGDIVNSLWSEDLENQPFSDKFKPVFS